MTEHKEFLIPLKILGINMDITQPVIIMWCVMVFIFSFLFLANKFKKIHLLEEALYEFFVNELNQLSHITNKIWFTFIITLFLFILCSNLSGLIPGLEAPTSNINVPAALAITVFILSIILGLYKKGLGFFKILIPEGVPKILWPLMIPTEFVSQLVRPFSLTLRLFANMFAGHTVLLLFFGFSVALMPFLKPLPFVGTILLSLFEIFVSVIQAFIFSYLTAFYITDYMKSSH